MTCFPARLAIAIVVVFLVVDTSALLSDGAVGKKSFSCLSSSRKTFPGKEGSFGRDTQFSNGKEYVPSRDLRSVGTGAPPAPVKNQSGLHISPEPPPPQM